MLQGHVILTNIYSYYLNSEQLPKLFGVVKSEQIITTVKKKTTAKSDSLP